MAISYVGQLLAGNGLADQGFPAGGAIIQTATVQATPPTFQVGDLIVVAALLYTSGTSVAGMSDSRGNTYTILGQFGDSSTGENIATIVAPMTTLLQAGDTLTLQMASGVSLPALWMPVVFRGAAATLDGAYKSSLNQFGNPWTTPSVTTTAQPELVLSTVSVGGQPTSGASAVTDTPNAGCTDLTFTEAANFPRTLLFQYSITSATGAVAGGGTFKVSGSNTFESYATGIAVVQAAAGGPTPQAITPVAVGVGAAAAAVRATAKTTAAAAAIGAAAATVRAGAPLISTFSDTFPGTTLDVTKWTLDQGTATVASSKLALANTSSYSAVTSLNRYDLTGSVIYVKVFPPALGANDRETTLSLAPGAGMSNASGRYRFTVGDDGAMVADYYDTAGTEHGVAYVFPPGGGSGIALAASYWIRIREASGTVFYDWSTDAVTWTNVGSVTEATTGVAVTNLYVSLVAGYWGTDTASTSSFAALNGPTTTPMAITAAATAIASATCLITSGGASLGSASARGVGTATALARTGAALAGSAAAIGHATADLGPVGPLQFLIPLYIYPTTTTFWADVTANHKNVAYVVANVNSGPDTASNPDYVTVLNNLHAAGVPILGYVDTKNTAVTLSAAEGQMDSWASWYPISGYFFDDASNTTGNESYYSSLNAYAKSKNPAYITVNNFGTSYLPSTFWSTGDITLNTEESEAQLQANTQPLQGWESGHPASSFAEVITACTSANLAQDLRIVQGRNAYYVWLAEDTLYQTEPSYWATVQNMVYSGVAGAVLTPSAVGVALATATVTAATLTPAALTATAQASSTAAASPSAGSILTPSATAQAAAACLVTSGAIPVTPIAQAAASATSSLTAPGNLTMTASATSTTACLVTSGGVPVLPNATATSTATSSLIVGLRLAPTGQASSAASATFRVGQGLSATATATATVVCIIGLPGSLRPSARAISSASATATAAPYTKVHLVIGTSTAYTFEMSTSSNYDLVLRASAAESSTTDTV